MSEIIVVLLIALLVIKPEQLPDVAHALGRFAKTIRQLFANVKDEMNNLIETADKSDEHKREQS